MTRLNEAYSAWAASWQLCLGKLSINILMLAGAWISLGIHVSMVPLYVDVHFLWFIVTFQSRARGDAQKENESEWLADNREIVP
jgi:hypothetical protein